MHALGGAALLTTNATALTSGIGSAGEGRPTTVGFLPWRAYDVFHTVQHERLADLDDVHVRHLAVGFEYRELVGFTSLAPIVPPLFRDSDFPTVL